LILTADFHTHTKYSDGEPELIENAMRAKELGLKAIGATDHGFSHIIFGMRRKKTEKFVRECREAEEKTGVRMLIGMESNIRGRSGLCDLSDGDFNDYELYLCGVHVAVWYETFHDFFHLGCGNVVRSRLHMKPSKTIIRETTQACIAAVERNPIDILTHLNYLSFTDPVEVAKCCRDRGTYLEISGKKNHLTDDELAAVAETGVRFVVNSDAHTPDRIGDVKLAIEQLERVGIPLDRVDNIDGRYPSFRLEAYRREKGYIS